MGTVGSRRLQEPGAAAGTPARSVVTSFGFNSCPLEEAAAAAEGRLCAAGGAPTLADSAEGPAPDDRYHAIYFAMLLAGVGFLLPYNSFITDVDHLHHKFPGTSIVFDMSLTYILVALVAVLLNNVLVERLSLHTRITAGYLLALGPLLFISICDVWLQLFSRDQAYAINLAAVGTVAFGCTAIQLLRVHGDAAQEVHAGRHDRGEHGRRHGLAEPHPHQAAAAGRAGGHAHLLPGLRRPGAALPPAAPAGAAQPLRAPAHPAAPRLPPGRRGRLPRAPRRGCGGHPLRGPGPSPGRKRVAERQPGPRGGHPRKGSLRALRRAPAEGGAELAVLQSPAAAPVRGGPRHLGRHAVHRRDLLHHAVPVPGARVRDPALRAGRVAAHPHHGRVQPLRLRGQDPGRPAHGLAGHAPAGLRLPPRGLHPPLHPVRLPQRHAHPPPPGLALRLLPAHGHQQRLLRQRAHDPGGRQSGPAAAGAGREHHDRVLHDGADAGLRRGLLHLQPHPRRPPELPPGLRRQRLLPRRSLSRSAGPALPREGPRDPHRGPPGPEAPSPPQPAVPASPGRLRASDATLSGSGRPHCSPRAPPALRGLGHVTVPHPGALPSTVLCVSSHAQASPSVCVQGSVGATHSHPHSEEWTANQCPCGDPHCQVSTEGPGPQPPRPQPLTEPLLPWGPSRRTACPSLPTAQL
ncbi:equilibrative nucleoside transporter 4 isoform X2 [Phyllostomus hastatus]|uniref:equilibrative nucleoside transporter 4 isoform X2 n=1 Tax=Phyllostomus hastatus TaxID=9423 RepID=UPI001E67E0C9|nr:equilibrative nucleoside transporter 4 isoform X2 [Phyllostomus hastatus]